MISVIVVNYNGKKFLDNCLSSLVTQTYSDFEVIVVDNGSSDNSPAYIRERYPSIILVEAGANLGFAAGTNAGIRTAKGDFVLTLNNDTISDPHLLEEIVQPMLSDPSVGSCGAKMLFPDGRINSTSLCISRSGAAWERGMGEMDHGQYDVAEEIFGPCAGAALYRRLMLDEIGLFDEDFFLFFEDVDLAFRARLASWKCMYVPTARVVHIRGGTANPGSDTAVYYGNRNTIWYVVKNFPTRIFILSLPWILGRNFAVITYYFLSGNFHAIVRAKIDAIKGLPHMLRKRRFINKNVQSRTIDKWIQTWSRVPKT